MVKDSKYLTKLKRILLKDKGAFVLSKILYSNTEKTRLKKIKNEAFGFSEQAYWTSLELIHLIQPLLKAKYSRYVSADLFQENNNRYSIKITTESEDLIFIMKGKDIEFVLVDPFKAAGLDYLDINNNPALAKEILSFSIFFQCCKSLDCQLISKYWDYMRVFAIKYGFYPKMIFHEEGIFSLEYFDLNSIEAGFCMYSGMPIKAGYFKNSQASSDFFNPRYSEEGKFASSVLNYNSQINELIASNDELNFLNKVILDLASKCGSELAKKTNLASKKDQKTHDGDLQSKNLAELFSSYFLKNPNDIDFDFFDSLLLMPSLSNKAFENLMSASEPLFERLVMRLNQAKKVYCEQRSISQKEFYQEFMRVNNNSRRRLTQSELLKMIKDEDGYLDVSAYRKVISFSPLHLKDTSRFEIDFDNTEMLKVLNEMLKLVNPQRLPKRYSQTRKQLFTESSFEFHRNTITSSLLKYINQKMN